MLKALSEESRMCHDTAVNSIWVELWLKKSVE